MDRRELLRLGAAWGGALALPSLAFARSDQNGTPGADRPRVLFVILRGACDTDSLLFQPDNRFYYQSRPTISIARDGLADSALKIDNKWALHPACNEMLTYVQKGQLSLVPFCGSGNNSRSHFLAQNVIEQAMGSGYNPAHKNGFVNRLVNELVMQDKSVLGGVCFSSQSPLICQGQVEIPIFPPPKGRQLAEQRKPRKDELLLGQLYEGTQRGASLQALEQKQIEARERFEENAAMQEAEQGNKLQSNLQQFSRMADLLKSGGQFSVGVIEIGGWDSHVNQGAEKGFVANKFRDLSRGLDAFVKGMGKAWSNTEVVVMSEFGRTFRENGSKGTDHGHASTWILMSGKGFSAPVLGKQIEISEGNLHEGRDLPVLNEYRAVMKQYTLNSMGLNQEAIHRLLYL